MNWKQVGDRGQNCAIGHLSRYGLGIAFPLSDNYPFDFIAIAGEKLFKIQVKSSSNHMSGAVCFGITTNNFYTGEIFKYSADSCDVIGCYDLRRDCLYLLTPKEFEDRGSFTIRFNESKNGQIKTCNFHDDFVISEQRIKDVFGFVAPDFEDYYSLLGEKTYKRKCLLCSKEFETLYAKQKYCNSKCAGKSRYKVSRPLKDELAGMVKSMSWVAIGKKYGVSDNAVRKWAKSYELI